MNRFLQRPRGTMLLKILLAAAIVAVGDVALFQHELLPAGLGFLGLALVAAQAIAMPAVWRDRRALFALALAAAYAFAMIYDMNLPAFVLFGVTLGMALLLPRTAAFDDGWRWFQRLGFHSLFSIAGPLPDLARIARARSKRGHAIRGPRQILPLVMLPLAGTLTFLWLFAEANPVIESWLASLNLPSIDASTLGRLVLWTFLIWVSWWGLRPRMARFLFGTFDGNGDFDLPGVNTTSLLLSLIAFNAIFLLQNAMDAAWLWGLVPLPDGLTLAQYAHRGAYPLVATALLTAVFVLVALRPGSRAAALPAIRRLVVLWIGQNLFLVFNAALRTFDYVETYSLTVLRISALLWMVLVAIGLVLVVWRMLVGKSSAWLINTNLAAAGIMLSVVCFVDLGAVAAQWNVRHAREIGGKGAPLDLCYLYFEEGSALLPLIELEQRNIGGAFGQRVGNVRREVHFKLIDRIETGGWQLIDARRLDKAAELLGGNIGQRPAGRGYACDGNALPPEPDYGAAISHESETTAADTIRQGAPAPTPAPAPTLTQGRER